MHTYSVWYPVSIVGAGTAGCQKPSDLRSAGAEPARFDSGFFFLVTFSRTFPAQTKSPPHLSGGRAWFDGVSCQGTLPALITDLNRRLPMNVRRKHSLIKVYHASVRMSILHFCSRLDPAHSSRIFKDPLPTDDETISLPSIANPLPSLDW